MVEQVLFEDERRLSRAEVASYLHTVATRLESGETMTLEAGGESVALDVPADVEFEVKVEREGPEGKTGELALELELEWDEDTSGSDGSLSIK